MKKKEETLHCKIKEFRYQF